jgi:hypothetical protein
MLAANDELPISAARAPLETATIGLNPNVGSTRQMRGAYRQYTTADTRPDDDVESGFFFEFPHKAGPRSLIVFYPATRQFPFLSFIAQEKDLWVRVVVLKDNALDGYR